MTCAAAAALLALYAMYAAHVSRTRHGVPCGCAGARTPMTGWVAGRAAALSALAAAGALHGLPAGSTASELFVAGHGGPRVRGDPLDAPARNDRREEDGRMTFQTSALLLSWVAILLLALVVAGLVRQVHALGQGASPRPGPGPAPGTRAPAFERLGPGLLLFLDRDCGVCTDVLAAAGALDHPLHAIFAGPAAGRRVPARHDRADRRAGRPVRRLRRPRHAVRRARRRRRAGAVRRAGGLRRGPPRPRPGGGTMIELEDIPRCAARAPRGHSASGAVPSPRTSRGSGRCGAASSPASPPPARPPG
ncbi:MauE/DoxX family redox-associated membrane protein [Actinomadura madurae]|uniref:MauE/DoxX family redox-associated membrane protein n=1 Tax=Actinomadura madurae TaxID=1993 RepID=UPI0020D23CBD|nr:MauE/DoxX family redox-associated membrane protein [Actinomadura madurae]MCP9978484.1 hypothetical protein [Actinomadura madurae]